MWEMEFSLALTRLFRLSCIKAMALRGRRIPGFPVSRNPTRPSGKPDKAGFDTDETLSAACFRTSGMATILNA